MKKGKKSFLLISIICAIVFLIGIGILLYPLFSAQYAESVRSEIRTEYKENIETLDSSNIDSIRSSAQEFNQNLFSGKINPLDPTNNGYFQQLAAVGTGIMGYVSIPKLNVFLPIYHSTSDDILQRGAGHMPQSSLPIGGENTHTVITAHSGMASDPLFSDLELVEIGDIFQFEVLDEVLTYEVYDVETVLPRQIESIQIQQGRDLATLVTCTPVGVNSHRLLVHGSRIPTPQTDETIQEEPQETEKQAESVWMAQYFKNVLVGLGISVGMLLLVGTVYLIYKKMRKGKGSAREE